MAPTKRTRLTWKEKVVILDKLKLLKHGTSQRSTVEPLGIIGFGCFYNTVGISRMNRAPPVWSSSRLYQPLWSGPEVDDVTGFYCIPRTMHRLKSTMYFRRRFRCRIGHGEHPDAVQGAEPRPGTRPRQVARGVETGTDPETRRGPLPVPRLLRGTQPREWIFFVCSLFFISTLRSSLGCSVSLFYYLYHLYLCQCIFILFTTW